MKIETFMKYVTYFCKATIIVAVVLFVYGVVWVKNDLKQMYARLDPFIAQCEASGNHTERHTNKNGNPQIGCYEGPAPKLIERY